MLALMNSQSQIMLITPAYNTNLHSKGPGVWIEGGVILNDVVLHRSIVVTPWHPHNSCIALLALVDLHLAGSIWSVCNEAKLKLIRSYNCLCIPALTGHLKLKICQVTRISQQEHNLGLGKAFDSETDSYCHERKSWIVVTLMK